MSFSAIATQGRSDYDMWTKTYIVSYSENGAGYTSYKENGATKVYFITLLIYCITASL